MTRVTPITPERSIVAYSCHFGRHEPYNPDALAAAGYVDRVVFTDHALEAPDAVRVVRLDDPAQPPQLLSRLPKLCPHRYFKGYAWTVYVDNNASLKVPLAPLLEDVARSAPDHTGRFTFPHHKRDCIFEELRACVKIGAVSPDQKQALCDAYTAAGIDPHSGLGQHTMLIQKMGDGRTDTLNETWLDLFQKHARRDQLTLRLAEVLTGTRNVYPQRNILDTIEWPIFHRKVRFMYQNYGTTNLPPPFSRQDLAYRLRKTKLQFR